MNQVKQLQDTTSRVLRGGGWISEGPSYVRAAFRLRFSRSLRYDYVGFRTHIPGRQPRVDLDGRGIESS